MTIVGTDIKVRSRSGFGDILKFVHNGIKQIWPKVIKETDETNGQVLYFCYATEAARDVWDAVGCTKEYADQMIFYYLKKDAVVVVVDYISEEIEKLINFLRDHGCNVEVAQEGLALTPQAS